MCSAHLVLSQCTRVTDRQTDGQTDGRTDRITTPKTALAYVRAVKMLSINDVLSLKAARRDATANLKCFGAWGHKRPSFDGFIYTRYAAPPHSAGISAITSYRLAKSGWVPFADLRMRCLAMKYRMHKTRRSGPFVLSNALTPL